MPPTASDSPDRERRDPRGAAGLAGVRAAVAPMLVGWLAGGCAPAPVPMALAEAQCMQVALTGGGGLTVGMATGFGGGSDDWGGLGISVATELPSGRAPAQVYASCVVRRTGVPPVTPFLERPELRG